MASQYSSEKERIFEKFQEDDDFQALMLFVLDDYLLLKKPTARRIKDVRFFCAVIKNNSLKNEEKILKMQKYLSGDHVADSLMGNIDAGLKKLTFKTGVKDKSKLEDMLVAAMDFYRDTKLIPKKFVESDVTEKRQALKACFDRALQEIKSTQDLPQEKVNHISKMAEIIVNKIKFDAPDWQDQQLPRVVKSFGNRAFREKLTEELEKFRQHHILPGEIYRTETMDYSLKEYIQFAIDQYKTHKSMQQRTISESRMEDMTNLSGLVDGDVPDSKKIELLEAYLKAEDSPFSKRRGSRLKAHCLNAIKHYKQEKQTYYRAEDGYQRSFETKHWVPANGEAPKKIIIALHGWNGHLGCWNNLGRKAREEGVEVIAYDQRGYGLDAEKQTNEIKFFQMRMDLRNHVDSVIAANPGVPVEVVGYSMGGSVVLSEYEYLSKKDAVTGVNLFSPAIRSSARNALRNILSPSKRDFHESAEERENPDKGRRYSISLRKTLTTFKQLFSIMKKSHDVLKFHIRKKKNMPNQSKLRVYIGDSDSAVSSSTVKKMKKNYKNDPAVDITVLKRGDHALFHGSHGDAFCDDFIREIKPFEAPRPSP